MWGRWRVATVAVLALAATLGAVPTSEAATGTITTVAGGGTGYPGDGGPATSAGLGRPMGVAFSSTGNLLFTDTNDGRVRSVDAATGVITTVAGGGTGYPGDGGPATSAGLHRPTGLEVDGAGNLLITELESTSCCDRSVGNRVRRVDAATGTITTIAGKGGIYEFSGDGGPATSAHLSNPMDLAVDGAGNLFIADYYNQRVRRVDAATGTITTVAGNGERGYSGDGGLATGARLDGPHGVAVDGAGNLLIADMRNHRVRRVDATTGLIATVAGGGGGGTSGDGGPATSAKVGWPSMVTVDGAGSLLIASSNLVRRVDAATGTITTIAGKEGMYGFSGDGGPATSAQMSSPEGMAVDGAGNLAIADGGNSRVRQVDGVAVPPSAGPGTYPSPRASPTGRILYTSIGDSYSSGEGSRGPYDEGTNYNYEVGLNGLLGRGTRNECRRSSTSWPRLLDAYSSRSMYTQHYACSGAVSPDVVDESQYYSQLPQVRYLNDATEVVTVTIGGNDIGFPEVVNDCVVNRARCDLHWSTEVDSRINWWATNGDGWKRTYKAIRDAAPNARVIVVGYTRLVADPDVYSACNGLDGSEMEWMRTTANVLNGSLRALATSFGFEFVNVAEAFDGREVCTSSPWLNGVSSPTHESFHPNVCGYQAYAQLVAAKVDNRQPTTLDVNC